MIVPRNEECRQIEQLFEELCRQPRRLFPQQRQPLHASSKEGVYIIRKEESVLHVGRTRGRQNGLFGRLNDHLHGASSFTREYLHGDGAILRDGKHTYQYLELADPRKRTLLEALATGTLCPEHIGLGG